LPCYQRRFIASKLLTLLSELIQ